MTKRDAAAPRAAMRVTAASFILLFMMVTAWALWPAQALALEFEALPGPNAARHFSIDLPTPSYRFDQCQSMLNHMRETGALSATEDSTPDHRGLAMVVGIRFALDAPVHAAPRARVSVWQPLHAIDRHALAMDDYEDCRKDQALRSAFGG